MHQQLGSIRRHVEPGGRAVSARTLPDNQGDIGVPEVVALARLTSPRRLQHYLEGGRARGESFLACPTWRRGVDGAPVTECRTSCAGSWEHHRGHRPVRREGSARGGSLAWLCRIGRETDTENSAPGTSTRALLRRDHLRRWRHQVPRERTRSACPRVQRGLSNTCRASDRR